MSNPFGPSPIQEIQELLQARKFAEAEKKARARIAANPDDPDLHALRASALLPMGQFDLAEKELRKCIELRPHEVTPWLNYGRFLQQTNRWGDALTVRRRYFSHSASSCSAQASLPKQKQLFVKR